jgi:hemerythrin-like domain-containing protein
VRPAEAADGLENVDVVSCRIACSICAVATRPNRRRAGPRPPGVGSSPATCPGMSDARLDIASGEARASSPPADAFEELTREHRLIQRVAAGLVRWASLEANQSYDGRLELRRFVGFFRHFVLQCHFAKEDAVALGPARDLALPVAGLGEMELGHQACRRLFNTLHQFATAHTVWSRPERRLIAHAAEEVASCLRDVFVIEETRVFPQLRAALPPAVLIDLSARLQAHEQLHTGRGEHERHLSMGEALARWSDPAVSIVV